LNIFKERKLDTEDFEVVSKIKNRHGLGMKFETRNFHYNEFPSSEMFKPFINRKFGIWLEDSNSNQ
jgi:hypothetical protein